MSGTRSSENTIICGIYSQKGRKEQYHHTDEVSTWESTGKKEKLYQSRKYKILVTSN